MPLVAIFMTNRHQIKRLASAITFMTPFSHTTWSTTTCRCVAYQVAEALATLSPCAAFAVRLWPVYHMQNTLTDHQTRELVKRLRTSLDFGCFGLRSLEGEKWRPEDNLTSVNPDTSILRRNYRNNPQIRKWTAGDGGYRSMYHIPSKRVQVK